jgi:O-antigen ligase
MPPSALVLAMSMYAAIFVVASMYQFEFFDEAHRRVASFAVFMTMFAYVFIRIDDAMVFAFKGAVVAISLLLTLHSIYVFFLAGGSSLGFQAKDVVGTQRIGFIYLLALWLTYLHPARGLFSGAAKRAAMFLLIVGLLLTFSRASVVALVGSFALYWLSAFRGWLRRPTLRGFAMAMIAIAAIALAIVLIWTLVPVAFDFFQERMIEYALDRDVVAKDLGNEHSTGGTRLFLWWEIVEFVAANPLTGTGYLGVWTIVGDFSGSAHNQYADTLLRTGVPGFIAYVAILGATAKYLGRVDRGLFWGFVAILIYGMFHETFKETHGGFVLAFLIGMLSQAWHQDAFGGRSHRHAHARAFR